MARIERANWRGRERPHLQRSDGSTIACPARKATRIDRLMGVKVLPHWWRYGTWNGNNKRVLPWWEGTRGIARNGWRCYFCGEMCWDESDIEFAARMANQLPGKIDVAAVIERAWKEANAPKPRMVEAMDQTTQSVFAAILSFMHEHNGWPEPSKVGSGEYAELFDMTQSLAERLIPIAASGASKLISEAVGFLLHSDVSSSICCCGDDMAKHTSPMDSGHVPVDSGAYYAMQWLSEAQKFLGEDDAE